MKKQVENVVVEHNSNSISGTMPFYLLFDTRLPRIERVVLSFKECGLLRIIGAPDQRCPISLLSPRSC